MIRTGLDRVLAEPDALAGRRYGLLSHAAAVTVDLEPAHLALRRCGTPPRLLLAPEHGFYGAEQDMVESPDERDPWTGTPIRSLYAGSIQSLRPEPETFTGLDLLLVDLQDVGARYYTYAATAVWAAQAASTAGCEVWILDRPNPLGGLAVEGPLRRPGFESFVGAFAMPVRHGLTLGELARGQAEEGGWAQQLRVWQVEGWQRGDLWSALGRPWVAPSPNLPSFEIAALYPGLCLVEGTNLSEGRGTTRPFQLVGAPWIEATALADELNDRGLPGVRFAPVSFRPQFQKHCARVCSGVEIRVTGLDEIRPLRTGVAVLEAARAQSPARFKWRTEPYEFEHDRLAIDLLAGDATLRHALDGEDDLGAWIDGWSADEEAFRRLRRPWLIYPEAPAGGP